MINDADGGAAAAWAGLVQLSHYSSDATLLLSSKNSDLHGTSTSCIN